MKQMGMEPRVIRAGKANMFLSPVFSGTVATLSNATIELYNTDGALGAARGAAWGAGLYLSREACFSGLELVQTQEPKPSWKDPLEEAYLQWKNQLETILSNI